MNAEPGQEPVHPVSTADDDQADADFGAGFTVARGEEPNAESRPQNEEATQVETPKPEASPPEPEKPASEEPVKPEAKPEGEKPEAKAEEPIVFAGLTDTQLKAALAKATEVDEIKASMQKLEARAFGRMGELQQALRDVKQTPQGQPRKVTPEMLKRISSEFADLAPLLAEDLSEISLGGGTVDVAAIEQSLFEKIEAKLAEERGAVDKRIEDINKQAEKRLLTAAHPDWQDVVKTDDFKLWRSTLPAEARTVLDTSWDSTQLIGAFKGFKDWKVAREKPAPTNQPSKKRLEAAVAPQGGHDTATTQSDDDAFVSGFNTQRRGTG